MKIPARLTQHPRLYFDSDAMDRLRSPAEGDLLVAAQKSLAKAARSYLGSTKFDIGRRGHNVLLGRARVMQCRAVSLAARWLQTGDEKYRAAALRHVKQMGDWEYWSWIAWRNGDSRPNAIYDLSYGENSATVAILYDWLHDSLSAAEKKMFLGIGKKRSLVPFLKWTGKGEKAWWYGEAASNWNTVCAGGAGMLALAMYDDLPEARKVLPRVEKSFVPYMKHVADMDGGWDEGLGYWNYGMRYAFMYLLSAESATGKRHELLRHKSVSRSLDFPLDFTPNGVAAGFGDSSHWGPMPFNYAIASRLGRDDVIAQLDERYDPKLTARSKWPAAAELLLLHPRKTARKAKPEKKVAKVYKGLDWGVIADRMPEPNLYASLKGGFIELRHHGHLDLMSFNCVVGDELMIPNICVSEYVDTTFSPRRGELFEMSPASKNTILVNGVGVAPNTSGKARRIEMPRAWGVRVDASKAMGVGRDAAAVKFCARTMLMLDSKALLIVDRVEVPFIARVESRLHTYCEVKTGKRGAKLTGDSERMTVAFASDVPAVLCTAQSAPTKPGEGTKMIRWCSEKQEFASTTATLLVPGAGAASVELVQKAGVIEITARGKGLRSKVRLSRRLLPAGK